MKPTQQKTLTSDLTADVLLSLKLRVKTEQQHTLLVVVQLSSTGLLISSKMRITSEKN